LTMVSVGPAAVAAAVVAKMMGVVTVMAAAKTATTAMTAVAMMAAAVTVVTVAELMEVAAMTIAIRTAAKVAATVVAVATATATATVTVTEKAVSGKDNGSANNGKGHRQQSTKSGNGRRGGSGNSDGNSVGSGNSDGNSNDKDADTNNGASMTVTRMMRPGCVLHQKTAPLSQPSLFPHRCHCRCAKILAAMATETTILMAALAVAVLKTPVATAVLWVVVHPCFFVRLACRGAPKIGQQR
jgi:hypothetical protein